jgi:protein-S-isoprenylcysteine O-methyltransferase Ste14
MFPPLLFAGMLVLGVILHFLVPLPLALPVVPARAIGVAVLVGSAVLARWGERAMHRAGTNVRPDQPTTAVVSDGPFRYSRNPLYLATTGLYAALALLVPAVWPLLLLVPLLVILRWGIIAREERYLETKFGAEYGAYRSRVRRWL